MMHKACHNIEEVPYCFSSYSMKFPGHIVPKINDLNPVLCKNTRPVAAIKSLRFALLNGIYNIVTLIRSLDYVQPDGHICMTDCDRNDRDGIWITWWSHQIETFSALLALCAGNSPVTGEFPSQRPVTRSFGVFFDLRLNKRLSKQWWGWWLETLSRSWWRHCNYFFNLKWTPIRMYYFNEAAVKIVT